MATSPLRTRLLPARRTYDGTQIAAQWALRNLGIFGDSAVAFLGPCDVPTEALHDIEDRRAGEFLRAREMLHLIVEHFGERLDGAVWRQRILVTLASELLRERRIGVRRSGNDLFVGRRKLSVSIASCGALSAKIHLGINIDPAGAPVPAIGLARLRVPARPFARSLLSDYAAECSSALRAQAKAIAL
ncbi:MAG: DUF366 family protein [Planctomycetes bacterium]|nr:DUF366 family protein [Planctomycetota bacterium]